MFKGSVILRGGVILRGSVIYGKPSNNTQSAVLRYAVKKCLKKKKLMPNIT